MKIFGREPAVFVGVIEAVLVLLLSFGLFDLTQNTIGLIMAVVVSALGLYTAYVTSETLLGAAIGFSKAALALATVYGLSLTVEQTGALIAVITVGFGMFQRTQSSPLLHPNWDTGRPTPEV